MAAKTLALLRSSVRSLYGDYQGLTADDTEVDLHLKDGVNRVLEQCPWIQISIAVEDDLFTTDVFGGFDLGVSGDIAQVFSVEVRPSAGGTYNRLFPVNAGIFGESRDTIVATTADQLEGYYLDGNRMSFYPILRSTQIQLRMLCSINNIGSAFPTLVGSLLPNNVPIQAEEAAIRYAVAMLHLRDNNIEAAQTFMTEFSNRVIDLTGNKNRPERGKALQVYQTDTYYLDADSSAW